MVPLEVLLNELGNITEKSPVEDEPLTPLLYVSQVPSNLVVAGSVGGSIFSKPYQGMS